MKKRAKSAVFAAFSLIFMLFFMSPAASAKTYDFSFEGDGAESYFQQYKESLPDDVKGVVRENAEDYDYSYFSKIILSALKDSAEGALGTLSHLLGAVILSAAAEIMYTNLCPNAGKKAFSFCSALCMSLVVWEVFSSAAQVAKVLLDSLSNAMLISLPAMEGILISSGNVGTAAVTGTGINLMITFGESVFSKVLYPGALICFFLSVSFAVCENGGIAFMAKTLRGIVTGALIVAMALMSFVLAIQGSAATAADTFAARTVRFAISSYLPIVGGSISESFSCLASSMNLVKQTCGITGIAVLLSVTVPPLVLLLANRLAIGVAKALAGALGCEKSEGILAEAGGVCTLLIAICAGATVMFLIAMGFFCKTVPAIGL